MGCFRKDSLGCPSAFCYSSIFFNVYHLWFWFVAFLLLKLMASLEFSLFSPFNIDCVMFCAHILPSFRLTATLLHLVSYPFLPKASFVSFLGRFIYDWWEWDYVPQKEFPYILKWKSHSDSFIDSIPIDQMPAL